jgi:hypothetical protein
MNMSKGDHLGNSNQIQLVNSNCGKLNDEAAMHQLEDKMDLEQPTPKKQKTPLEEMTSMHAFC